MFLHLPDLGWLSPVPWMTYKGRLNRIRFWSFYLFITMVSYLSAITLGQITALFPQILGPIAPYVLLTGISFIALLTAFAMIRRLRDADFHWSLVPLSMLSGLAAIMSFQAEVLIYSLNEQRGTQAAWLDERWPVTEVAIALALIFNVALIYALTRKSKPPKAEWNTARPYR